MYLLKSIIRFLIRIILKILPFPITLALVKDSPRIAFYIPSNRKVIFEKYLGDIKVKINTCYRGEREMLSGYYEPLTLSLIDRFVKKGNICIDIGANVGAITFALAKKVGHEGKIFAFEPAGFLFKRLNENINLNPELKRIIYPFNIGISDKEGILYFAEDEQNPGNVVNIEFLGVKKYKSEPVPVITIDKFFQGDPPKQINFVKIDVECMEYEVIKGGLSTWGKYLPILYYETFPGVEGRGPVFSYIEDMLKKIGYVFFKIGARGEIIETSYPDLSNNTLAIPKKTIALLNIGSINKSSKNISGLYIRKKFFEE